MRESEQSQSRQRQSLGFRAAVLASFQFLEEYGYHAVEEGTTLVRYENPSGYVNVYHGRSSYEVGVEVGPLAGELARGYSMSLLIQFSSDEQGKAYRNPVATSPETVRDFVKDQAQRLRTYGQRILQGDTAIWQELESQRRRWSDEYAAEILLSQVRPEADSCFRQRDFNRVVELLSPVEDRLTPAERMKLEYARKQTSR
jgi:hypothetical protein